MPVYTELPIEKTPSKLADWLEINALLDSDECASAQDLKYILENEEERENQIEESSSSEIVSQVFDEINNRITASTDGYPFKLVDGTVIKKKTGYVKFLPYTFCLLLSYYGPDKLEYGSEWKKDRMAKKFEELSGNVIKGLLKNKKLKSTVKIFGYPRRWKGKNTNPRFKTALEKICIGCGEMKPVQRATSTEAKDGGLDVIAWKKFPDQLQGGFVFAWQCCIGQNWTGKLGEVDDFFNWYICDSTQKIKGIFIPHLPDLITDINKEHWLRNTLRSGMIFNRSRIALLAENWKDHFIEKWYRAALKKIREQSVSAFK